MWLFHGRRFSRSASSAKWFCQSMRIRVLARHVRARTQAGQRSRTVGAPTRPAKLSRLCSKVLEVKLCEGEKDYSFSPFHVLRVRFVRQINRRFFVVGSIRPNPYHPEPRGSDRLIAAAGKSAHLAYGWKTTSPRIFSNGSKSRSRCKRECPCRRQYVAIKQSIVFLTV